MIVEGAIFWLMLSRVGGRLKFRISIELNIEMSSSDFDRYVSTGNTFWSKLLIVGLRASL